VFSAAGLFGVMTHSWAPVSPRFALRTGETDFECSPSLSFQCAASLRAQTLESSLEDRVITESWAPVPRGSYNGENLTSAMHLCEAPS
jgi:hypothetical protein